MTALYDACVLYPATLRSLLVQLATMGLVEARWSARIHEEWIGGLLRQRTDLTRDALQRVAGLMDAAVPDCLVHGLRKPDPRPAPRTPATGTSWPRPSPAGPT